MSPILCKTLISTVGCLSRNLSTQWSNFQKTVFQLLTLAKCYGDSWRPYLGNTVFGYNCRMRRAYEKGTTRDPFTITNNKSWASLRFDLHDTIRGLHMMHVKIANKNRTVLAGLKNNVNGNGLRATTRAASVWLGFLQHVDDLPDFFSNVDYHLPYCYLFSWNLIFAIFRKSLNLRPAKINYAKFNTLLYNSLVKINFSLPSAIIILSMFSI